MSDLKLYKGINNIDDDLIEEANCKQKPVIHHCYALAASVAAIFIAAGATGIVHNTNTVRKPAPSENVVITEDNVTTSANENKISTTTNTAISTTYGTVTSAKTSVSYSRASTTSTVQTTAVSVSTSVTAAVSRNTETETVDQDVPDVQNDVQNYDFEYEGSIIMKKYTALLSSLLLLTNGTAASAQAQTYVPENEEIATAEHIKTLVEKYDIDLDLNCDGKFDIFDLYAFYRAEVSSRKNVLNGSVVGTIPDYIQEKYDALPRSYTYENTYFDSDTGKEESFICDSSFDTWSLFGYYFTYYNDISLNYFEPEFYIDNCPDDYQDNFPYDFIRRDGKHWDMWNYQKTKFIKEESDGSYRFYNEDDAAAISKFVSDSTDESRMRCMEGVKVSPIHEFIGRLRYLTHYTGADYVLMKDFVEQGYADVDIDSNGVFDFEDIIKIALMTDRHCDGERDTFIDYLFRPDLNEYQHYDNEFYWDILNEDEWNKSFHFLDTAANYFGFNSWTNLQYLAQYYLTDNEIDAKYFDPLYYEERNLIYFESNAYICGKFFENIGYYESFSIKYGPKAKGDNEEQSEEWKKRYDYTERDVNEAFPVYYKKVKTGVLPKPDIDLDGKVGVSDYNILYNLNYEMASSNGGDYISTMMRHHPELKVEIGISQEVRDNFNTNFDFNNNGISGDNLEIDCMMMYILNELSSKYTEDELNDALDTFYVEHPELQYYEIFKENLKKFNKTRKIALSGPDDTDTFTNISGSVDVLKNYSSFADIAMLPTGNGDANGDGNVDLSDAVLIMQYIANPSKYGVEGSDENHITDEGYFRADVDGKGVTNMDALTIQKYLLGLCDIEG